MKNQELVIEKERWKKIRLSRHGYIRGAREGEEGIGRRERKREREREGILRVNRHAYGERRARINFNAGQFAIQIRSATLGE